MIGELDTIVLTHDVKEHGLERGDVGAVVHCYHDANAFEVEFVTGAGNTVALLVLRETEIRPMSKGEILHAREFSAA